MVQQPKNNNERDKKGDIKRKERATKNPHRRRPKIHENCYKQTLKQPKRKDQKSC